MTDPYSILGVSPGADEETLKKAYRQKCKQYHPDLHPGDALAEENFKKVQAAYSEIQRLRSGGATNGSAHSYGGANAGGAYRTQDPFGGGFGYGPFGFGFYSSGPNTRGGFAGGAQESPALQAAANYLRNGYPREALSALEQIPERERTARWHYYAAMAHQGLGNNIRATEEARIAVSMEPNNYAYQNLLDQLQNPTRSYADHQQPYAQPGGNMGQSCLSLWLQMMLCWCCCGRGGFFCC